MLARNREERYWLLQYNPDRIDMISYLRDHGDRVPDWWIKEKNSAIGVGDVVFVWKAKGSERERCVLGRGRVIPCGSGSNDYRRRILSYLKNGAEGRAQEWLEQPYFEVRYEKLVLDDPVSEDELLSQGMSKLGSFGFRTRRLGEKDAQVVETLVDQHEGHSYELETPPAAIDIKGLRASFKGKEVIKGIDLSIPAGKVTAIIGPSGCGKTTMLRCLNRLAELTEGSEVQGEIRLDGQDIRHMDPMMLRRQVGMVFQKPNPFPMSVRANILYGVKANHLKPAHEPWVELDQERIPPWHEESGIGEYDPPPDCEDEEPPVETWEEVEGDEMLLSGSRIMDAIKRRWPWAAMGRAWRIVLESSALRAMTKRLPWLLSSGDYESLIESCLTRAALWDELEHRLKDSAVALSLGQQQRLCIARTLAISPRVILMDEPAASLDPISTSKLESSILAMKGKHTVVIVTHNMQEARRISDYTAFLYMGELVEFGETHNLFESPRRRETREYVAGRFG